MSLIALLFAFALLIWMIPIARSGRLLLIGILILATGTVCGPNFFSIDGPIQISIDRLLFFVLVCMAVVGLRLGTTRVPSPNRIDWLVLGMVGWFGFSALTGGSDPPGTPPVARWMFYLAMPAGMYGIARLVKIKTDDIHWIIIGLITLGVYLSATAVFEVRGLHGLVFPRYIVDPSEWEFFGRGRGPLMNPSGNGFVISTALAAALIGLVQSKRDRRIFYGVVIACLAAGVYATLTRSAWLGGVATIGAIGLVYAPRSIRVVCLCALVILVGIATTSAKEQIFRLKRDQNLSAADAEKSVKLRPLLAIVAWEMFKDSPLTGHGFGHYFAKRKPYHDDRGYGLPLAQARPYAQHNVFLSVLVDTGLIGITLFVSWFLSIAAIAWQLARDGASRPERRAIGLLLLGTMATYFCNAMFQDTMIIPMVHMFLFFIAGVAVTTADSGLVIASAQRRRSNRREPSRSASLAPRPADGASVAGDFAAQSSASR